jgi:4-amino-4-deoxy-L-arabinose transferase-like glycosyltransferase
MAKKFLKLLKNNIPSNQRQIFLLFLILLLAAFLRLWQLGQVPPSPDWDEAALGYNAYSIMKTGRDEYGQFLPLILRSFDDYKPGIYAYLAIPTIKLFGLNTFAVRLPAALLGTLAVLLVYLLVKALFKSPPLSLMTALLMAISPWHLQFSRIAFESGVGLFFNLVVVYFFLKGLKKPWFLTLAAFFAGLNFYVYQAEKVFTPLLVLALAFIWRKKLFQLSWKSLLVTVLVGFVTLIPFLYLTLTTPEIFLRAKGTSFAADLTPFLAQSAIRLWRDAQNQDTLGLFLDNRRVTYGLTFVSNYFSHFDLNWLFLTSDDARHHAPAMGNLYLWELPFFLYGLYLLAAAKFDRKAKLLIFSWFLIAPIAAAFSSGAPHSVRTLRFLPTHQIFIALGIFGFRAFIKKKPFWLKVPTIGFLVAFACFNFACYLDQYFVQQNFDYSQYWQYGYQKAVETIKTIEPQYEQIVVSNQPHLDQSYIFFLFYLKYDPEAYQKSGGTVSGGFAETHRGFDQYTFRPIKWEEEEKNPEILYVGRPEDFFGEVKLIKTIYFLDGEEAIKLVEG